MLDNLIRRRSIPAPLLCSDCDGLGLVEVCPNGHGCCDCETKIRVCRACDGSGRKPCNWWIPSRRTMCKQPATIYVVDGPIGYADVYRLCRECFPKWRAAAIMADEEMRRNLQADMVRELSRAVAL